MWAQFWLQDVKTHREKREPGEDMKEKRRREINETGMPVQNFDERAHMRATHKWHTCLPSSHFIYLLCQKNKAHCVGGASFACHSLAHRNRSDFGDFGDCDAHRGPQKSQRFPKQEKAMMHCDLGVRWKVVSDLRFRAAISEPKTPSFCGISGGLAPSAQKSLVIAIVRFWCAKCHREKNVPPICEAPPHSPEGSGEVAALVMRAACGNCPN